MSCEKQEEGVRNVYYWYVRDNNIGTPRRIREHLIRGKILSNSPTVRFSYYSPFSSAFLHFFFFFASCSFFFLSLSMLFLCISFLVRSLCWFTGTVTTWKILRQMICLRKSYHFYRFIPNSFFPLCCPLTPPLVFFLFCFFLTLTVFALISAQLFTALHDITHPLHPSKALLHCSIPTHALIHNHCSCPPPLPLQYSTILLYHQLPTSISYSTSLFDGWKDHGWAILSHCEKEAMPYIAYFWENIVTYILRGYV